MQLSEDDANDRTNAYFTVVAKLKPGVPIEAARSEMRVIAEQLERAYPKENAKLGVTVFRLRDELSPQSRLLLVALLAAAVGVLLIACTNLANILLARALSRRELEGRAHRFEREQDVSEQDRRVHGHRANRLERDLGGHFRARSCTALPIAEVPAWTFGCWGSRRC